MIHKLKIPSKSINSEAVVLLYPDITKNKQFYLYDMNKRVGKFFPSLPDVSLFSWEFSKKENLKRNLFDFLHLHQRDSFIDKFPELPKIQIQSLLGDSFEDEDIDWASCIKKEDYILYLQTIIMVIRWIFKQKSFRSYFYPVYQTNKDALYRLEAAKIDESAFSSSLEFLKASSEQISQVSVLSSFQPDEFGMTNPVEYNFCKGLTGRLSVSSGPKILNLDKSIRKKILKPSIENGSIVYMDYSSLEPRIARHIAYPEKESPEDLYMDIVNLCHIEDLKRDFVKIIVMKIIFGASLHTLRRDLQATYSKKTIDETYEFILNYFRVREISGELEKEYRSRGHVKNFFGRPIFCKEGQEKNLYPYFIQSSGVDAALTGFAGLSSKLNTEDGEKLLYIVHDACIIDLGSRVNKIDINLRLAELQGSASQINNLKIKFPLSSKIIR